MTEILITVNIPISCSIEVEDSDRQKLIDVLNESGEAFAEFVKERNPRWFAPDYNEALKNLWQADKVEDFTTGQSLIEEDKNANSRDRTIKKTN